MVLLWDLAVIDESGCCKITGRTKDMVIRGGENIYPIEIEEFFLKNKAIKDIQIIGVDDEKMGQEVCAWIIL
jgi:acyl-CoA synthetase (AMP-forming)/AMP-acid ligase II